MTARLGPRLVCKGSAKSQNGGDRPARIAVRRTNVKKEWGDLRTLSYLFA
jgi:hypothetical protein